MVRLWSAISGRKRKVIGEGSTLWDAIQDANLNPPDIDANDKNKMEDYVQGASQDYVIEDVRF